MFCHIVFVALVLVFVSTSNAYRGLLTSRIVRSSSSLYMSTPGDPLEAIKAKMAADPSYDPLKVAYTSFPHSFLFSHLSLDFFLQVFFLSFFLSFPTRSKQDGLNYKINDA